jgi:murein DD-endopeptidase MepM/ murein hydrolase activator NlpD
MFKDKSSVNTDKGHTNIFALGKQIMSKRLQKKIRTGAILFLLGLSLAVSIIVFSRQEAVLARNSSWQGASFPVENFQAYTSPFGYRPSATGGGGWEFHSGLDIAAPRGSYIRNWWTGVVTKVEDRGACGTHIVIQSGQWQHTYCHMEGNVEVANGVRYMVDRRGGIQIAVGMQIPAGSRIGRVGMSGRTTGPHLHWGLKFNGNHVDPAFVLRAMFAQQPSNVRQARQGSSFINQQQREIKIQESKFIRDSGY